MYRGAGVCGLGDVALVGLARLLHDMQQQEGLWQQWQWSWLGGVTNPADLPSFPYIPYINDCSGCPRVARWACGRRFAPAVCTRAVTCSALQCSC